MKLLFLDIYKKSDRSRRHLIADNKFMQVFPKYTLEAFGMILLATTGYIIVGADSENKNIIPWHFDLDIRV